MECNARFYLSAEDLENTPSRKDGFNKNYERDSLEECARFILNLGGKLRTSHLCVNTAIVFWQRFFMFHSMKKFSKHLVASAALFLSTKSENRPVKLEHIIYQSFRLMFPNEVPIGINSNKYKEQLEELLFVENVMLMTLGFQIVVEHPHLHIAKHSSMIQAPRDIMKLAYFTASRSLHATSLCLQYKPTTVACLSIHLAALKLRINIPNNNGNQPWFMKIDEDMTADILNKLALQYLPVFNNHKRWSKVADKMFETREAAEIAAAMQATQLNQCLKVRLSTINSSCLNNNDQLQSSLLKVEQSKLKEDHHSSFNDLEQSRLNIQEITQSSSSHLSRPTSQKHLQSPSSEISRSRESIKENLQPSNTHSRSTLETVQASNDTETLQDASSPRLATSLPTSKDIMVTISCSPQQMSLKRSSDDLDSSIRKRQRVSNIKSPLKNRCKNHKPIIVN